MPIKIVSAGAGSGKTYRLTSEMVDYLKSGTRPEGIIATTFTKKAAAELQERVRVRLLTEGLQNEAEALTNALIGTVHGLGVKLLQRFAYEAGVSPQVAIIADEDHQFLFNQALATILSEVRIEKMEQLSIHLGLIDNTYFDWRKEVRMLTEVARSNNFTIEVLEKSKEKSFEAFQELLGTKGKQSPAFYDQRLLELINQTIQAIDPEVDATKATQSAVGSLKKIKRNLNLKNRIDWKSWAKLGKLKTGAKSRDLVEELTDFAKGHYQHPLFHQDIKDFIYTLFEIAIDALAEYERYKKERGLIDYTDMEVLVSKLLDQPGIQEVLRDELDLLMVDEFQDTSPIQLEIFLKLSKYAKASVWVGDPKQSIYGFRGAAPELMEAIIQDQGGVKKENIQKHSWRSRADLVDMTNALFTKAFTNLPKDQVALIPKRKIKTSPESSNKKDEPIHFKDPLFHWHFEVESDGSKRSRRPGKPWMENAIAATIKTYLDRKDLHFWHRETGQDTLLAPGDIAVLCRSNSQCQEVADALHRMGLKAAISRAGLLQTAEAKLILACLKFLLNRNDSLSIAEILLLAEGQPIEDIIQHRLEYLESSESEGYGERWAKKEAIIRQLNELRKRCADYSSAETLDTILEELEVRRIAASWGNVQQRFDNIDRLRYLAQQYEEACNRMYSASSLGGFLLWMIDLERNGQDLQASGESQEAVNVLTYHRSKGLEWPLVVCHSLDQNLRADVWGLEIVPEVEQVDIQNLLGNRWLRYWINPYDRSLPGTYLAECLESSPVQQKKKQQALQEESRLLYVGLTRARDYLVFPTSSNPTKWLNRTWHQGKEDYPTLDANTFESPWEWDGRFLNKQTETFVYPKVFEEVTATPKPIDYWENRAGRQEHILYRIDPIQEADFQMPKAIIGTPNNCGTAFISPDPEVNYPISKAIKAYLTGFQDNYDPDFLDRIAQGIIDRYEVEAYLNTNILQGIAKNWNQFLSQGDKPLKLKRKVPLHHFHQQRHFQTYLDYVVIEPDRIRIYQSSGGHQKKLQANDKAMELAPWFYLVQEAYQQLYPTKKIETYLHLVLQGLVVQVDFS